MYDLLKKNQKPVFYTILLTLAVHMMLLTNFYPTGDSMYATVKGIRGMIFFGRWLSGPLTFLLSSPYDLPWASGFVAACFLSLTAVLLSETLGVSRRSFRAVLAALLVVFPSTAATLIYSMWSACYFAAMFSSVLAVYICVNTPMRRGWLLSAALLVCGLAVYQAYFLFAVILAVYYLALALLDSERKVEALKPTVVRLFFSFFCALLAYLILTKLVNAIFGITLSDYQGISTMGQFNPFLILRGLVKMVLFAGYFFIGDVRPNFYAVLNLCVFLLTLIVFMQRVLRSPDYTWKRKALLCVCFLSFVPINYAYCLASPSIFYHRLMEAGNWFLYAVPFLLFERTSTHPNLEKRELQGVALVLLCVLCFYHFLNDNVAYKNLQVGYERTFFEMSEILGDMDELQREEGRKIQEIAVFGGLNVYPDSELNPVLPGMESTLKGYILNKFARLRDDTPVFHAIPPISGADMVSFLHGSDYFVSFAKYYLNREYIACTLEKKASIADTDAFQSMSLYPGKDYLRVIDNTIVVRLSEEIE